MKSSKIFIFSLALFGTLLIGGPALSPSLSHGDSIAQAADTTTKVIKTTVRTTDGYTLPLGSPFSGSLAFYSRAVNVTYTNGQTTMKKIMDVVNTQLDINENNYFAPLLDFQLTVDVANQVRTAEQAAQAYNQPRNLDQLTADIFKTDSQDLAGYTIDQQKLQKRLNDTVTYDSTSNTVTYDGNQIPVNSDGTPDAVTIDFEVPFVSANTKMAITYRTSDGTALPDGFAEQVGATKSGQTATKTITGYGGQVIANRQLIPEIPGYTPNKTSVTFSKDTSGTQQETITYNKTSSSVTTSDSSSVTPKPTATQSFRVYGKQKLYRYQHVDFKKSERIQKYATKPSTYAPVFTVVNTTQSKAGNPRYQLSDGTYITAKSAYVGKLFLEDEAANTLYVTNPKGIWTHTTTALSDRLTHLKQGSKVAVTKLVKAGNTTRYQLANGTFVTGNQRYVTTVKPQRVARVKAKGNRNLYSDVNLTHRLKHYRKGHIFTVKGWDYSRGQNQLISGTKRYKVAGGYITGNPKLVKIIK